MLVWHSRPRLWDYLPEMKSRQYRYTRNLPHIEKDDRPHFITFDAYQRWQLPPKARDLALAHCLHDNGSKMRLHVAVIMPDHVHLIFTPLRADNTEMFTFEEIVGAIKGASAHSINKALNRSGRVWRTNRLIMSFAATKALRKRFNMCATIPSEKVWSRELKITNGCGKRPSRPNCKTPQPRAAVPHDCRLNEPTLQLTMPLSTGGGRSAFHSGNAGERLYNIPHGRSFYSS